MDDTAHGSKTCRILSPHASDVERIRDRSGRKASGNVDPTGQQGTSSRIRSPKRPVMPPSSISVPSATKTVVASPAVGSTPPATDRIGLAPHLDVKCVALRMEPGDDICPRAERTTVCTGCSRSRWANNSWLLRDPRHPDVVHADARVRALHGHAL